MIIDYEVGHIYYGDYTNHSGVEFTVKQIDKDGHKFYSPEMLDWKYWDFPAIRVS